MIRPRACQDTLHPRTMFHARAQLWPVAGALAATAPFTVAHCRAPSQCVDLTGINAARNMAPPAARFTPIWERSLTPSLNRMWQSPPILGSRVQFAPPPPRDPPPQVPFFAPERSVLQMASAPKRRRIMWPKKPATDDEEKAVEIRKWQAIVDAVGPDRCRLAATLVPLADDVAKWRVLEAVCAGKSPATLRKHAGALKLYMRWAHSGGNAPFPFREVTIWNYVAFLHDERAPATRADSFLKAAFVAVDLLTMYCSTSEFTTTRIEGAVKQSLQRKRLTESAPPFTVKAVEVLERAISDESLHDTEQLVAGFV